MRKTCFSFLSVWHAGDQPFTITRQGEQAGRIAERQAGSKVDIRTAYLSAGLVAEREVCVPAKGHARIQGVETTVQ